MCKFCRKIQINWVFRGLFMVIAEKAEANEKRERERTQIKEEMGGYM